MNLLNLKTLFILLFAWLTLLTVAFVLFVVAQTHWNRETVDVMGKIVDLIGELK